MSEQIKKLPWSAFTQESFSGWYAIKDNEELEIGSGDGGLEKEEAEFICRACNSHDQLVMALQRCLIRIEEECADPEYLDCVISAREALAGAGEQS